MSENNNNKKQKTKKAHSSMFLGLKTVKELTTQREVESWDPEARLGLCSAWSVCSGGNEHQVAPTRRVYHDSVTKNS